MAGWLDAVKSVDLDAAAAAAGPGFFKACAELGQKKKNFSTSTEYGTSEFLVDFTAAAAAAAAQDKSMMLAGDDDDDSRSIPAKMMRIESSRGR